jgi:hypothetical protein
MAVNSTLARACICWVGVAAMRAIVIGGSLGGLYTAIVLSDLGW